ncbi:UNVERIFIED_CONTAM: hypothetical protein K2H54_029501 [Gekko kuhli]
MNGSAKAKNMYLSQGDEVLSFHGLLSLCACPQVWAYQSLSHILPLYCPSHSTCRHKSDTAKLLKEKIDATMAAKGAEFAKKEENMRRESVKLPAEKDDRKAMIKSLHRKLKAKEMAAHAKILQEEYQDPELNFNPAELREQDPSQ